MCDYSLHGITNRLAREGEVLTIYRFSTGSKGLSSPPQLNAAIKSGRLISFITSKLTLASEECAVCIPDGARLVLKGIPDSYQQAYGLAETEQVTFRQLSAEALEYRDAVEFHNGRRLRLQQLEVGQMVEVISLPSMEETAETEQIRAHQLI